jgi:hypothetical protein
MGKPGPEATLTDKTSLLPVYFGEIFLAGATAVYAHGRHI